jgi:hypothetical protein
VTLAIRSPGDLMPGDLGFTSIKGRTGAAVLGAQTAIDLIALLRGRRADTSGWLTHAYVVTGHRDGRPWGVEAMPSGARHVPIGDRIGPGFAYARLPLPPDRRLEVASVAASFVDIPYGFAQYAAIAGLTVLGGDTASPRGLLARYVQRRNEHGDPCRMICSQLCDEAMRQAKVHLFDDGRPPAYVTPGALWWRCAQLGEIYVC